MAARTVTRLYDDYGDAQQVVRDLEAEGIPHSDISLIARNRDTETTSTTTRTDESNAAPGAGLGAVVGGGVGLLTGLGLIAIPGVGPVVAAGWLAALLAGAAVGAGAGGIVGAMTSAGIDEREAHVYAEGVRRGGALVTVRTDEAHLARVNAIMRRNSEVDPAARRAEYEAGGWTGYRQGPDDAITGADPLVADPVTGAGLAAGGFGAAALGAGALPGATGGPAVVAPPPDSIAGAGVDAGGRPVGRSEEEMRHAASGEGSGAGGRDRAVRKGEDSVAGNPANLPPRDRPGS